MGNPSHRRTSIGSTFFNLIKLRYSTSLGSSGTTSGTIVRTNTSRESRRSGRGGDDLHGHWTYSVVGVG